ncbi:hypothetical protein [Runella sp.]|jgi:hypothetical protein|nr:hypothetical protein [Runella sp.]
MNADFKIAAAGKQINHKTMKIKQIISLMLIGGLFSCEKEISALIL